MLAAFGLFSPDVGGWICLIVHGVPVGNPRRTSTLSNLALTVPADEVSPMKGVNQVVHGRRPTLSR